MAVLASAASCKPRAIPSNWLKTIAEVDKVSETRKATWFTYRVGGKTYTKRVEGAYSNMHAKERYGIYYDPANPQDIIVEAWDRVIGEDEDFVYTVGIVTEVYDRKWYNNVCFVRYSYRIGEDKVETYQSMPRNFRQLYPDINVGKLYNVQVSSDNLYRSVILIKHEIDNKSIGLISDTLIR